MYNRSPAFLDPYNDYKYTNGNIWIGGSSGAGKTFTLNCLGVLNLSENEVRQITRFRRGEGLLCIGYNHVPIAFHATEREYNAITTSPTDLRRGRSGRGGFLLAESRKLFDLAGTPYRKKEEKRQSFVCSLRSTPADRRQRHRGHSAVQSGEEADFREKQVNNKSRAG